jgi:hypothetical protein
MPSSAFNLIASGLTKLLAVADKGSFEVASVDSSAIDEIGYNKDTMTLLITFNSGSKYSYSFVPESEYESLVEASSVGKHFVREVRNNYIYNRVG